MWKAKWKALRSVILTVPIPRFCHILLQNMISLCAQIELNSWSVTCTPSNFPRAGKPRSEKFPAATTLSASLYLCCCFFFFACFFSGAVSFCSGIFLLVAFWTEADIFNAPLLFFECGKLFAPAFLLLLSPFFIPLSPPFLRVKANEARDRAKRRPFCWRFLLPLFHATRCCLFLFICPCIGRNFKCS